MWVLASRTSLSFEPTHANDLEDVHGVFWEARDRAHRGTRFFFGVLEDRFPGGRLDDGPPRCELAGGGGRERHGANSQEAGSREPLVGDTLQPGEVVAQ